MLVEAAPNPDENNPYHLGEYSLQISEDDAMVDRYADDDDNATELAAGDAYQGAISPWTNQPTLTGSVHGGDDLDYFSFSASRGVRYTIEIEPGTSEGVAITLLKTRINADDEIVETNSGVGNTVTWTSPTGDDIFVKIGGTNRVRNPQGTYTLRLNSETELQDWHPEQPVRGSRNQLRQFHRRAPSAPPTTATRSNSTRSAASSTSLRPPWAQPKAWRCLYGTH